MSTVSGSIVVAASSLTEDIFKLVIPHHPRQRHPMLCNRARRNHLRPVAPALRHQSAHHHLLDRRVRLRIPGIHLSHAHARRHSDCPALSKQAAHGADALHHDHHSRMDHLAAEADGHSGAVGGTCRRTAYFLCRQRRFTKRTNLLRKSRNFGISSASCNGMGIVRARFRIFRRRASFFFGQVPKFFPWAAIYAEGKRSWNVLCSLPGWCGMRKVLPDAMLFSDVGGMR